MWERVRVRWMTYTFTPTWPPARSLGLRPIGAYAPVGERDVTEISYYLCNIREENAIDLSPYYARSGPGFWVVYNFVLNLKKIIEGASKIFLFLSTVRITNYIK